MDSTKILGLVFDLSLRHMNNHRIVDAAKRSIVQYTRTFDDDDGLYVYHPELTEVLYNRGDQISAIANYETDGYRFDLSYALKHTLYVLGSQDYDITKTLCLITDRLSGADSINHLKKLNDKDDLRCEILVIGISNKYCKNALAGDCGENAVCVHVDEPSQIQNALSNWFTDRLEVQSS